MNEDEDHEQRVRQMEVEMEFDAQLHAKRGDNSKMIALLRKLHKQEEIPDLCFIADLLEGKYKKPAGRPAESKILAGLKMQGAAQVVRDLIEKKGMTIDRAVVAASEKLFMSESSVKKHYYQQLKREKKITY